MHNSPRSIDRRAFTLIELLVVIVIITVLLGLLFPAFRGVQDQAKKTQAKNDLTQIVTAVNAYYTEYGKYPVTTTSNTTDAYLGIGTTPTGATSYANNDVLIDVLRNNIANSANASNITALNPRGIAYLDVPPAKSSSRPISGVIPNGATSLTAPFLVGVWYDPWGSPYNVLIDTNYDNNLTNPYQDTPPPGGTTLTTGVVSWSFGKNGALGGGSPVSGNFSREYGTANNYSQSGDVISWQ